MVYECVKSTLHEDTWIVEAIDYDNEGVIYGATFDGPDAEARAKEYAAWKNGEKGPTVDFSIGSPGVTPGHENCEPALCVHAGVAAMEREAKEWTPASWNACPTCENSIDADDVHDGSEVYCHGCEKWLVVVEYEGGTFGLRNVDTRDTGSA